MTDKEPRKVRIPSANFGGDLDIFGDMTNYRSLMPTDSATHPAGGVEGGDDGRVMSWGI